MSWTIIDISRYQGNVDFSKVKSQVDGIIIRAGIGKYSNGEIQQDSKAIQNIEGALKYNISIGLYYFTQATTEAEAVAEADFLLSLANKYTIKLPLVYDLELEGRVGNISKNQRTLNCIAFYNRIKAAGKECLIYTYKSVFNSGVNESQLKALNIDRWIAHYTDYSHPEYATEYAMWQYTSGAKIDGISGNVDKNICYKDYFSGGGVKVQFTKRLTAPSTTDKNWIGVKYGGNNHALVINSTTGSVLSNCCGFVHGRWCELGLAEDKLCRNNAEIYWGYTGDGFKRGQEPKLGAIACWRKGTTSSSDGAGHVAIVEAYTSPTNVQLSQSNYGGTRFYTGWYNPKTWPGGKYVFQGYIYPPVDYENDKIGTPVARNKYTDQIEVLATTLRARSSTTTATTSNILGVANTGIFNLLEIKTENGYIWAKIGENIWIATREGDWTKLYPKEDISPAMLKIGPASSGDIKTIENLLITLQVGFTSSDSYIITTVTVSVGDKKTILAKCEELGINCVDYEETPETDEDKIKQLEAKILKLETDLKAAQETVSTDSAELQELTNANATLAERVERLDKQVTTYADGVAQIGTIISTLEATGS